MTTIRYAYGTDSDPYATLVDQYRAARQAWHDNPAVQEAAVALQMGEREYCDRYIGIYFPPRVITTTTSGTLRTPTWAPLEQAARDRAFEEARL